MHLVDRTVFFQNVALKQGGAVSVAGAGKDSRITKATFHQNVAAFGGALLLEDCPLFRCTSKGKIEFTENIALDGGAVHLVSRAGLLEAYKVLASPRTTTFCYLGVHVSRWNAVSSKRTRLST